MLVLSAALVAALAAAPPDTHHAVLHVGVHREAGTVYDIAADGADGQCTVARERLTCAASGPVTFRWGGDVRWELEGASVVQPGETAEAWVLVADGSRADAVARLAPATVTAADVRDLFVRTGADPVAPPSPAMLEALWALAEHPDVQVRMALLDAVVPWWRRTASDPLPASAPSLVPVSLLDTLARDPERRVRRRLANRLREVRSPGTPMFEEVQRVLLELVEEGGSVQRAAMASLSLRARADDGPAEITWQTAMRRVATPGPPGRAAANTLGHLAQVLEAGPQVDPAEAVDRVFQFHRERTWNVWAAWRDEVPFDPARAEVLFRETEGWSPRLLTHWAETDPDGLAAVFEAFEPRAPHSERYRLLASGVGPVEHPRLQQVLEPR